MYYLFVKVCRSTYESHICETEFWPSLSRDSLSQRESKMKIL